MLRAALGRPPGLFAVKPQLLSGLCRLAGRKDIWERLGASLVVDPGKLLRAGWTPAVDTKTGLAAMIDAARADARTRPASAL